MTLLPDRKLTVSITCSSLYRSPEYRGNESRKTQRRDRRRPLWWSANRLPVLLRWRLSGKVTMPAVTHLPIRLQFTFAKGNSFPHNLYKRRPPTFNGNVLRLEAVTGMKIVPTLWRKRHPRERVMNVLIVHLVHSHERIRFQWVSFVVCSASEWSSASILY